MAKGWLAVFLAQTYGPDYGFEESFVGFVALFHALGFQIIPPKQIAGINIPGSSNFSAQSAPVAPVEPGGYVIKSPWSQEKPE